MPRSRHRGAELLKPASSQAFSQPNRPGAILRQFRIVFNAVKTHFQQVETLAGASGAQVWALHVINERPGLRISELARAMDIRQPTASIFVKGLAAQELVTVRRDGQDRRAVQLHATSAGRKLLRKAPGPFAGVLPQAIAELDEQTLAQLEVSLGALIRKLDTDDRGATIPLAEN